MVWNAELSLRVLAADFLAVDGDLFHVALVHIRQELREADRLSFCPALPAFITCQSRKAESTITNQKTTVLTVEFTEDS